MKAVRTIAVGIAILAVSCLVLLPGEAQAGRRGGGCCCGWSGSYGWDNCGYSDCGWAGYSGRGARGCGRHRGGDCGWNWGGCYADSCCPTYQTASYGGCGTGCCPSTAGPGATTSGRPNAAPPAPMAPGSQNAPPPPPPAPKTPPSK